MLLALANQEHPTTHTYTWMIHLLVQTFSHGNIQQPDLGSNRINQDTVSSYSSCSSLSSCFVDYETSASLTGGDNDWFLSFEWTVPLRDVEKGATDEFPPSPSYCVKTHSVRRVCRRLGPQSVSDCSVSAFRASDGAMSVRWIIQQENNLLMETQHQHE